MMTSEGLLSSPLALSCSGKDETELLGLCLVSLHALEPHTECFVLKYCISLVHFHLCTMYCRHSTALAQTIAIPIKCLFCVASVALDIPNL